MDATEPRLGQYRTLILVLAMVWIAGAIITSCGSGGSSDSADGKLCDQCGSAPEFTDPPCDATQFISGGPPAAALCNDGQSCTIALTCLRKQDDAQRRCFPSNENGDLAQDYECDGARPGGTLTPRPTRTPTPTPASTSSPDPDDCGNNRIDVGEECDGTDLDGNECADICDPIDEDEDVLGNLRCNTDCTFNTSECINAGVCE
jgi:hypothetical protein